MSTGWIPGSNTAGDILSGEFVFAAEYVSASGGFLLLLSFIAFSLSFISFLVAVC